ncbi:MAG: hypothetical protein O2931_03190 [Planctomycetota bacterium]|nr:hypothetical protein [Planctomycetota bacterium]MDA1177782.1 hypothetical protein [Planctomycetota bacterium]
MATSETTILKYQADDGKHEIAVALHQAKVEGPNQPIGLANWHKLSQSIKLSLADKFTPCGFD